jgi:hypothetical protein
MNDRGTDDAGLTWTGWLCRRRGGDWQRVCQAGTLGECAKILNTEGDRLGVPSAQRVMTGGGPPRLPQNEPGGAETARGVKES